MPEKIALRQPRVKIQRTRPVLNDVKDLTHLERSFEAQDARSAHFEPGTLNFCARLLRCSLVGAQGIALSPVQEFRASGEVGVALRARRKDSLRSEKE
jgi:hypothetical protein